MSDRTSSHRVVVAWRILWHGVPAEPDWTCDECGKVYDRADHRPVKLCERCAAALGVRWEGRGSVEPETGRELGPGDVDV